MLAVNAFLFTLIGVVIIGAIVWWFLGRPLLRRVDDVCETIDHEHEAKQLAERLEREEVERHRKLAEKELDEQIPRLRGGSE